MAKRELTYVGEGGALPGIPACSLVLDDGDKSHEDYAKQIQAGEQHHEPVLITKRQIERLGYASAAAMASALSGSELYSDGSRTGSTGATSEGATA